MTPTFISTTVPTPNTDHCFSRGQLGLGQAIPDRVQVSAQLGELFEVASAELTEAAAAQ